MVLTIKESGFCHGVQKAIDRANSKLLHVTHAETDHARPVVCLFGDIVNNAHVMENYRKNGYIVADVVDDIPQDSIVIIRAHGITRDAYNAIAAIPGVEIEDCTCDMVKRTHKIVEEESQKGAPIVVVGKKNHPEVIGICGWSSSGAVVFESEEDLSFDNSLHDSHTPLCVVAQTTVKPDLWDAVAAQIKKLYPSATIHNTLCGALTTKLESARDLARKIDTMVVVGDKKSANSVELYETCAKVCAETYFVSGLYDVMEIPLGDRVGLVGSASTPREIIDDIYDYLSYAGFMRTAKVEIDEATSKEVGMLKHFDGRAMSNNFVSLARELLWEQNANGKRVRGTMIKLGEHIASGIGNAGSASKDAYITVAAIYEIFQTAILIHDDIIDRSNTRRGIPTIHHAVMQEALSAGRSLCDAKHFGISQAICIGDYGLFLANNMLAHADVADDIKVRILQLFSQIQLHTIEGEITDVSLPYKPINPAHNYAEYMDTVGQIYWSKTAWYTLAGPLMIGAICAGGQDDLLDKLCEIAIPLGIAFQIKDDLLGMYATDAVLGKPAISDLVEAKQTMLYGYAYKHATAAQRDELEKLYGKQDATTKDLIAVRDIFTECGAMAFAQAEIAKLSAKSLELIASLDTAEENKSILHGLVAYMTLRKF